MINPTREQVLSSLFSLLTASAAYATASRRLQLWTDSGLKFPCLFMAERGDTYVRATESTPGTVTVLVEVYIYTQPALDSGVIPATLLNNLLDALDTALAPSPLTGLQTLGNLVSHCWVEGKVMKDPGDLDGFGVAVVPVKILLPQ